MSRPKKPTPERAPRQVSGETIRHALKPLGVRGKRAKHWLTSPDPSYVRKKPGASA